MRMHRFWIHVYKKIIRSGQLYDLLAARNKTNSPNTYIRGTQTIDFIFGTENIYNSVRNAGMLPFNHGTISDHRALWLDLHIPTLFKGNLADIYTRPPQLTTKNLKWAKQARKIITQHLMETNVRTNLDSLLNDMDESTQDSNIQLLERIDSNITDTMLRGAQAYNKNFSIWWSPAIHHAYLETKYCKS